MWYTHVPLDTLYRRLPWRQQRYRGSLGEVGACNQNSAQMHKHEHRPPLSHCLALDFIKPRHPGITAFAVHL